MASRFAAASAWEGVGQSPHVRRTRTPRLRLRYVALAAVCGWAVYYYAHVQRTQLVQLQQKEASLRAQLKAATATQVALKRKVAEFQNDTFIARYASEQFHLIQPGQVSFVLSGK
ncbi:MAG: septum formation initiator family protein [Alicyclobacillus sp.]|nr:septum formation initiator family protein [Alicyclobacillus sp.]